jgi:multiple sugar transport system substrate-binding protein
MHMRRLMFLAIASVLVAGACGGGGGSSGSPTSFDASKVSGTVVFSGWQASPEEGVALNQTLNGFKQKYPNIKVDYQPIQGDYPTVMVAKFSAHQPPDLFYVDSAVAPDWIKQGVVAPIDDYVRDQKVSTSQFYPGYLDAFKGQDGKLYGLPKDGNTLALAYNQDVLSKAGAQPPTTWDEMLSVGQKLKSAGVAVPYCMSKTLDRVLAFMYQDGGGVLSADKKKSIVDSAATKDALNWYLNLYKLGLARTPDQLGVDWCGKALGEQKAAMIFEGGWLDSFMKSSYPNVKYTWSPIVKNKEQVTLAFTVSYSIGKEAAHKEAAWVLMSYLTGPEGMKLWTEGGVANPSRKDVAPAAGKEVLVQGAKYAKPWSFIAGWSKITDTFNNSFSDALEGKTTVDTVISKTKDSVNQQLSSP